MIRSRAKTSLLRIFERQPVYWCNACRSATLQEHLPHCPKHCFLTTEWGSWVIILISMPRGVERRMRMFARWLTYVTPQG